MAGGELFIDLEHCRYAEIPAPAVRPESRAADEQLAADQRRMALQRLKLRAATDGVIADLLTALGLDE